MGVLGFRGRMFYLLNCSLLIQHIFFETGTECAPSQSKNIDTLIQGFGHFLFELKLGL